MKAIVTACLTSALLLSSPEGYKIHDKTIEFIYPSDDSSLEVFVSGNFNQWSKETAWKMTYSNQLGYVLRKPVDTIYQPGKSFYEFTFRVNGQLIDANSKASNVIHCAGYGSRYLIHF